MQVKVFNEGVPGSSMWIEPAGTWEKILAGKSSPDGKYISVTTAIRLIAEAVTVSAAIDWHGSEGGTLRRLEGVKDDSVIAVEYRDARKMVSDDEIADWPSLGESDSERAERIASEIGDRKLDRQIDNQL